MLPLIFSPLGSVHIDYRTLVIVFFLYCYKFRFDSVSFNYATCIILCFVKLSLDFSVLRLVFFKIVLFHFRGRQRWLVLQRLPRAVQRTGSDPHPGWAGRAAATIPIHDRYQVLSFILYPSMITSFRSSFYDL